MKGYILAIDQGTTSSRAMIFNRSAQMLAMAQKEFTQICPKSGWVEHNASEIWESVLEVVTEAVRKSGLKLSDIAAIGIANQRETTVIWDRRSGEPVHNAICWQSRQSQEICEDWISKGYSDSIHRKTGLVINPYFSASKVRWILDNVQGVRQRAENGELCFGTIDSFLVYKLTGGKLHITDVTNASRTMMFNINTLKWDSDLLEYYGIPQCMLPKVVGNSHIYGKATALKGADIPIAAIIGDQQASLFGQCCFEKGSVKNTYGTGCFMLINTCEEPVFSKNGLLTTIAWQLDGKVEYALEGSVFIGGSAIQWLRDGLKMFARSSDCEQYVKQASGSDGVYVVPAFVGLGTPYWDNDARGAIFGLTRTTSKEQFVTATLESIAYQSKDVMEVMQEETGTEIKSLSADGGASANNYLMQFQANILNVKVSRPKCLENTALGAAYLAGLAAGVWKNRDEIAMNHSIDKVFASEIGESRRRVLYNGWKKAVEATRVFK